MPWSLQVPVLMHGHVVNWIDSKATFGSARLHLCARGSLPSLVQLHAGCMHACRLLCTSVDVPLQDFTVPEVAVVPGHYAQGSMCTILIC